MPFLLSTYYVPCPLNLCASLFFWLCSYAMFQIWIGCWAAVASSHVAMQGMRFDEELNTSKDQLEEQEQLTSSSPAGWLTDSIVEHAMSWLESDEDLAKLREELKDDYDILEMIGQSSHGKVYRAQDKTSKEQVVIKKLNISNKELSARMEHDYSNELHVECELLMSLENERIVKCLKNFDADKIPIVVLEDAGVDAFAYIRNIDDRLLRLKQAIWIIEEAVEAVEYLASERVMHRDLKPNNIAVKDGAVKLIDFGNAIRVEENSSKLKDDDKLIISEDEHSSYSPPEVRRFWACKCDCDDAKAELEKAMFHAGNLKAFDLWSLGKSLLSLFKMVFGSFVRDCYDPEKGVKEKPCLQNAFINANANKSAAPEQLDELLDKALELLEGLLKIDPKDRYR
eukprot:TRINITY_DN21639_c0_g1_i1.p1 TRINITY_DN21639_c0_g1~~TRINITY_DN21639_c0_g1_i1.p1  ORF type:complete len:398 (-),score=88.11 TRINITY_DN21639_c0_g1_i1:184-1377(-)